MGAGCFFLSNIVFKIFFDEVQYGQYSIVITYLSIAYILGLFGLEQGFLRYSNHSGKNTISTQKIQLKMVSIAIIVSSILATIFFKLYFIEALVINPIILYLATVSMILLLFIFNIFRLNSDFILAQFIANSWRIFLLIFATIGYFFEKLSFINVLYSLLYCVIFIGIMALYLCFKRITFRFNAEVSNKEIVFTAFQFFISIIAFTFLAFGDRFIIESKFGLEEFGNYFYLTNFFLAPFTIFQNYIGFKQLVLFKKQFSIEQFNAFNKKFLGLGSVLAISLFVISYVISNYDFLKFDFQKYTQIIILLLILGLVRLYSASINSAFEAKTTLKSLQKANLIFIALSIVILFITLVYFTTLEMILISIIVIWFLRCTIMRMILIQQISTTKNVSVQ